MTTTEKPTAEPVADASAEATVKPVIGAESAPVSFSEYVKTGLERVKQEFTPPDFWSKESPPLETSWVRARYGKHLPEDKEFRRASQCAGGVLIPFEGLFLYLAWIFRSWSRVIAAAVLVLVLLQIVSPIF